MVTAAAVIYPCLIALATLPKLSECQKEFNYEVLNRVVDELDVFTNLVHRAIEFPALQITRKNSQVDLSNLDKTLTSYIYPVKLVFPEVSWEYLNKSYFDKRI